MLEADAYQAILATQLVLGVATIFISFLIGVRFLPGYWPLLPALFTALSPHLVSTASYMLAETLFTFTLLLSLYAFMRASDSLGKIRWVLAGVCFALTYMINPVSFFFGTVACTDNNVCKK